MSLILESLFMIFRSLIENYVVDTAVVSLFIALLMYHPYKWIYEIGKKGIVIFGGVQAYVAVAMYCIFSKQNDTNPQKMIIVYMVVQLSLCVLYLLLWKKIWNKSPKREKINKDSIVLYAGGCLFCLMLVGLLIPSTIIHSSPLDFVDASFYINPVLYICGSLFRAAEIFGLIAVGVYLLADTRGRRFLERLIWAMGFVMAVDYMFFGHNLGNLSGNWIYDGGMDYNWKQKLINLLVVIAVFVVVFWLISRFGNQLMIILIAEVVGLLVMSMINIAGIQTEVIKVKPQTSEEDASYEWELSREGQNVVVIILDRAMGEYVPYIMTEKPDIQDQFAGFTYYSNTISYGKSTIYAIPSVYGGYEYTPYEMNLRDTESIKDKYNEAYLLMPTIFGENGYQVTVGNPGYANYQEPSDLSIYENCENVKAWNSEGNYINELAMLQKKKLMLRNTVCFAITKCAPLCIQEMLYNNGNYNSSQVESEETLSAQIVDGPYTARGSKPDFVEEYNELKDLRKVTTFDSQVKGNVLIMYNSLTHEQTMLQEPEYEPTFSVDNLEYEEAQGSIRKAEGLEDLKLDTASGAAHYQDNVLALRLLGNWFDYLREENVYDNTRIIIVSDHGYNVKQLDSLIYDGDYADPLKDLEFYYPLLMVKDFDSKVYSTSEVFMTNADVPNLAMKDLIDNPMNPFTGKMISDDYKKESEQYVFGSLKVKIKENMGNTFIPGTWFEVHSDMRNVNNWTLLTENSVLPVE